VAKKVGGNINGASLAQLGTIKGTSIGNGKLKTSSMNKSTARSFKKYRGQGR